MSSIKIVTDSTCDIPDYLLRQYEISVVPLQVQVNDEVFLDRVAINSAELFRRLNGNSPGAAITHPPAVPTFERLFRNLIRQSDVLVITVSSKLSATYATALRAREGLGAASAAHIAVVDSLSASMGLGLIVLAVAKAARTSRYSLAELASMVQRMTTQTHVVFFAETYDYLPQGGRAAKVANLIEANNARSLLRLDEGAIVPFERARTRAKAIEGLYNFVEDFPHVEELALLHSGTPNEIELLLTRIHPIYPRERVLVTEYSAVLGTHLGPSALGAAVYEGDDR
jgi:DegV family protein with EDD domain